MSKEHIISPLNNVKGPLQPNFELENKKKHLNYITSDLKLTSKRWNITLTLAL